jgi:hypothetical protein
MDPKQVTEFSLGIKVNVKSQMIWAVGHVSLFQGATSGFSQANYRKA